MSITARVSESTGTLHTKVMGTLSYADFLIHLKETRPRLAPGRPELFDARGAVTDMTTEQIRDLCYATQGVSDRGEIGPTAIVATDDKVFGLARMYSGFCEGRAQPVLVFRDFRRAEEWLARFQSRPTNPKAETTEEIATVPAAVGEGLTVLGI